MHVDYWQPSVGKQIEKDDILYKVSDGISLKDSFVSWVCTTKKELIKTYQSIVLFKEGIRQRVAGLADNPKALKKVRLSIALSQGTFFQPSSPGGSSSSVPSLESSENEEVLAEVVRNLGNSFEYRSKQKELYRLNKMEFKQVVFVRKEVRKKNI